MTTGRTDIVSQPRLSPETEARLSNLGLRVHCYQPVSLFKPGKRTLPNVPNKDDPWEVFLRSARADVPGVLATACGDTLREAIELAISKRPGVRAATARLADAVGDLAETIQCL